MPSASSALAWRPPSSTGSARTLGRGIERSGASRSWSALSSSLLAKAVAMVW